MSDPETVGRIMDKAAQADRQALFAGLQAALLAVTDFRDNEEDRLRRIERALDVGAPYGSPEHLASLADSVAPR